MTTSLVTIAGAIGMRFALRGSRAGFWGPVLIGIYGLGLVGAGVFSADPALRSHGMMHFVCGESGSLD